MKYVPAMIFLYLFVSPLLIAQQINTGYNLSEVEKSFSVEQRIDQASLTRSAIITTKFGEVGSPQTISLVYNEQGEVLQSFSGENDYKLITNENSDIYGIAKLVPGSLKEQSNGLYFGDWSITLYKGAEQLPTQSIKTNSPELEISPSGKYLYTKTYPFELYNISDNGSQVELDRAYQSFIPAIVSDKLYLFSTSRTSIIDKEEILELRESHLSEISNIEDEIRISREELVKYLRDTPEYSKTRVQVDSLEQLRYRKTIEFRKQINISSAKGIENTKLEIFDLQTVSMVESLNLNELNSNRDYWFDFNKYKSLELAQINPKENSISIKFNFGTKSDQGRIKEGERIVIFGKDGQFKTETETYERILDYHFSNSNELLILTREGPQKGLVSLDIENPERPENIQLELSSVKNLSRVLINSGNYIIDSGNERNISATTTSVLAPKGNQRKTLSPQLEGKVFIGTNSLGAIFIDTSSGNINIYK